jgi:NADPH:quinone reductase-like Zn-dependent oxidoreductase
MTVWSVAYARTVGSDVLRLVERDRPHPRPGEVVVRVAPRRSQPDGLEVPAR